MNLLHISQIGSSAANLCSVRGGESTWPTNSTCGPCVRAYDASGDRREPVAGRRTTYEHCGCLTNDAEAHRGECPEFRAIKDASGRPLYWVRREEAVGR